MKRHYRQSLGRVAIIVSLLAGGFLDAGLAQQAAPEAAPAAKSSPQATQIYQDAANFQNNGAFEVAVEEWQKLLKEYPADPLVAKGQHYLGVCLVQLKQTDKAIAAFQAVIKNHPKMELLEDTWLNLASSQYSLAVGGKREMYAQAADSFATLIEKYPKGKYLEEAQYFLGESLYAQGKKAEAAEAYKKLLTDFPKSKRRADTLYALGVAQEEFGKHAEAGATYGSFLKEFAENPLSTEVRMRKAETILQAGDFAQAEKIFGEVAATAGFASADHALYRQAYALAKLDRYDAAAALYAKVVTDFPRSTYVADATMSAGRSYYKAEKFDEAATWFNQAIAQKNLAAAEAAHWLARILIRKKQPAEAAELAAAQVAAGGDSPYLVHLRMDQADALYEIPDRRAESLPLYTKLAADHPQHELAPQALYNAAFTALDLKQYDAALKSATAFLTAYPQDKLLPDVKYVAAECQLQLKKYAEAEKAYAELVAEHPMHAEIDVWQVRQGLVTYLQKKYPQTVAILTPVASKLESPDAAAEAHFLIGASQFELDKFAEAAKALASALEANSKWRQADEAMLLLARSQHRLGQTEAASATAEKLTTQYPDSQLLDQAHYRLGEFNYAADDYKAAVQHYDQVAAKWPDSPFAPYALHGKGWSQLKMKAFPAAIESFTALVTRFPEHQLNADARFGRAMARRQSGDSKGAIADIEAYIESTPDRARLSDALYERGLAQVAISDFAAAASSFNELLKADPKYTALDKVLYELGWANKSQDKHAEAVPVFARLAAEFPNSPLAAEAWFHVGEDRYEKKEYAEAAKAYAAVVGKSATDELSEKGTYKLGWSHFQLKQYEDALKHFSQQLTSFAAGPLAADAAFMKAECLFRMEDYEAAWPAYQAAAKTKASTPAIETLLLLHGGQSASQLKQWDDALTMLGQIPEKFPESPLIPEAAYETGWVKHSSGKADEALKDYEIAAAKSRDHVGARARFMMGEVYFEQKQHDQAVREFQRAMFGYGGEQATAETKNWQAKAGYEAGRAAEVQIMGAKDAARQKLIADAKRFYTFVVEKHANNSIAAEAKKRLDALSKL